MMTMEILFVISILILLCFATYGAAMWAEWLENHPTLSAVGLALIVMLFLMGVAGYGLKILIETSLPGCVVP